MDQQHKNYNIQDEEGLVGQILEVHRATEDNSTTINIETSVSVPKLVRSTANEESNHQAKKRRSDKKNTRQQSGESSLNKNHEKKEDPPVGPPTRLHKFWGTTSRNTHCDANSTKKVGEKSPTDNSIHITLTMSTRSQIDPPDNVESYQYVEKILEPAPEPLQDVSSSPTKTSSNNKKKGKSKRRNKLKNLTANIIQGSPLLSFVENLAKTRRVHSTIGGKDRATNSSRKETNDDQIQVAIAQSLETSSSSTTPVGNNNNDEADLETAMALSLSLGSHNNNHNHNHKSRLSRYGFNKHNNSGKDASPVTENHQHGGGGGELAFPSNVGSEECKEEIE